MKNPLKQAITIAAVAAATTGAGVALMTSAGAASKATPRYSATAPNPSRPHTPPPAPQETPLSGTDLTTATAAVQAALPSGATIVRIESNASGSYPYEAHVVLADGTREIVELNSSFQVITTIADQGPGPRDGGPADHQGPPPGPQETPLTGTDLTTATAAVQATLPSGATIVRIESNAQGSYPYEAHVVLADGTREIVELNSSFQVIRTIADPGPGPRDGGPADHQGPPPGGPEGHGHH